MAKAQSYAAVHKAAGEITVIFTEMFLFISGAENSPLYASIDVHKQ